MIENKWLLRFTWLVFFMVATVRIATDTIVEGFSNMSMMTSIDISFFMFYAAWYSTLNKDDLK